MLTARLGIILKCHYRWTRIILKRQDWLAFVGHLWEFVMHDLLQEIGFLAVYLTIISLFVWIQRCVQLPKQRRHLQTMWWTKRHRYSISRKVTTGSPLSQLRTRMQRLPRLISQRESCRYHSAKMIRQLRRQLSRQQPFLLLQHRRQPIRFEELSKKLPCQLNTNSEKAKVIAPADTFRRTWWKSTATTPRLVSVHGSCR